jgi:predicted phosphate transport protein (TIGR00153 family)
VLNAKENGMSRFIELFRVSPFEPLREHMAKVMECVDHVQPMFEAVRDEDYDRLESLTKEVFKTEHQADLIKDEIRQTIPKTFFLPVYRGDMLGYLKLQDDMADSVEDVAFLLTIKKLTLPPAIQDEAFGYVAKVLDVCRKAYAVSEYLKTIVDSGFAAQEVSQACDMVAAVEKGEWKADREQYKLAKALFALDDELKATDILLWFKTFGEMGTLANAAEKTADRIRRMLTSH